MFIGLIRHNICPAFGGGGGECVEITTSTGIENTTVGEYESFTVDADVLTGSTPITYQWQRKYPGGSWANISGATNETYTESGGLSLAQSYTEYRCNMSNDCSSVTSRLIIIEVTGFLP